MNLHRTLFILPNVFTMANLFSGFFAISLCAQGGAGGSGGAVRIVARSVSAAHTARVSARAGKPGFRAGDATAGRIRLESVDNSARTALVTEPIAVRVRR